MNYFRRTALNPGRNSDFAALRLPAESYGQSAESSVVGPVPTGRNRVGGRWEPALQAIGHSTRLQTTSKASRNRLLNVHATQSARSSGGMEGLRPTVRRSEFRSSFFEPRGCLDCQVTVASVARRFRLRSPAALVAELADAHDSGSCARLGRGGSTPLQGMRHGLRTVLFYCANSFLPKIPHVGGHPRCAALDPHFTGLCDWSMYRLGHGCSRLSSPVDRWKYQTAFKSTILAASPFPERSFPH